jgi:hypothetical protein
MGYPSYEEKGKRAEHFSGFVKITRVRREVSNGQPKNDPGSRETAILAEIAVHADSLEALTRKLNGHIALVDGEAAD